LGGVQGRGRHGTGGPRQNPGGDVGVMKDSSDVKKFQIATAILVLLALTVAVVVAYWFGQILKGMS
jgi:hypothetical protein